MSTRTAPLPLVGVCNPHEPHRDRIMVGHGEEGRTCRCVYCYTDVMKAGRQWRYDGEKHTPDCPLSPYVAELQAQAERAATGQGTLLDVLTVDEEEDE